MSLTKHCISDLHAMVESALIPGISDIVGYDAYLQQLTPKAGSNAPGSTHATLVAQGKCWAEHIQEPWCVLVLASSYIIFSVGLNVPLFGVLSDVAVAIARASGADFPYSLAFTPRTPYIFLNQPWWSSVIGGVIQICDALFYVFIIKLFVLMDRWVRGRPMWARHGNSLDLLHLLITFPFNPY